MSDMYWQDTNWIDEALEDALSWADADLADLYVDSFLDPFDGIWDEDDLDFLDEELDE